MLTNKKDENFIRISNLVQISNNDNELFIDCYFSRDKLPSLLGRYEVICWIIQVDIRVLSFYIYCNDLKF